MKSGAQQHSELGAAILRVLVDGWGGGAGRVFHDMHRQNVSDIGAGQFRDFGQSPESRVGREIVGQRRGGLEMDDSHANAVNQAFQLRQTNADDRRACVCNIL